MSFKEVLEKDYVEMLNLKESIGNSRLTYQSYIKEFIRFCSNNYPDAVCITKEMMDLWLQQKHFKTNAAHNSAISRLREFTRYQVAIGKDTFVPGEDYSVKRVRYTPYIFTDAELQKLFEAFENKGRYTKCKKR